MRKEGEPLKIQRISTIKVSELVENQLEQWISTGHVQQGEKLPSVRELCAMFEVGRSAVRDAITSLKGKGMVEVKQGEGTYVCKPDFTHVLQGLLLNNPKDVNNLYTVRRILEVGIAEISAQMRRPEHVEQLRNLLEDLMSSDQETAWKADLDFHQIIVRSTGNEVLEQLMQTISTTMRKAIMDCHRIISSNGARAKAVAEQHQGIYEAIAAGDPAKAKEEMLRHLSYVEDLFQ